MQFGYENRGKDCSQKEDSKTASPSQTQVKTLFLVKWSKKPGWPAADWKKTFSRCNNAGNDTILRQTNQNMLFMLYSWFQCVLAIKIENAFFSVIYSSKKPSVFVNKAKYIVGAMKLEAWSLKLEHVKRRNSKIAAQVILISPTSSKAYAYLRQLQQTPFYLIVGAIRRG